MAEAALSFLGLGMPVDKPSLVLLISIGFNYIFSGSWWITAFPGICLVLLVLVINLLGDWLRDLFNPRFIKINQTICYSVNKKTGKHETSFFLFDIRAYQSLRNDRTFIIVFIGR